MLSTLDTVIAFAVIMTVLSLLITIIVQMVSAAFSLRGKNLANALALTFQTIDPKIGDQAHSLAAQILRDPIFSDSIWRLKDRRPVDPDANTQALIDAEKRLKRAEEHLIPDPTNLGNQAAVTAARQEVDTARALVTVPTVTPNRLQPWGVFSKLKDASALGSAIRPGEIYRIVNEFADLTPTEAAFSDIPPELVSTSASLLACLRIPDQPAQESKDKLKLIKEVAGTFTNEQQQKAVLDSLANFGATVERATTEAYDRFQRWFGSAQDRAEQWFQTHVRVVTIAFSICAAFVLQLDTSEIYRKLRDQPKLVEALVKSAPSVLQQGASVTDATDTPAYHAYRLWLRKHPLFPISLPAAGDSASYRKALEDRLHAPANELYPGQRFQELFEGSFAHEMNAPGAKADAAKATALKNAYAAWSEEFPSYHFELESDGNPTQKEEVVEKINQQAKKDVEQTGSPAKDPTQLLSDYDGLQVAGATDFEKSRSATLNTLKAKLGEAGFDLVPDPFWERWKSERLPEWTNWCFFGWVPRYFFHVFSHFVGILATAGLLALGAPFWFNMLKNLTSLRPALATLIEKRPTSAPALPAAPSTPPSPS